MKVCFVAAPLTARSGVYRSSRELVEAGRRAGYEWSLLLGVSNRAAGGPPDNDPEWIHEMPVEPRGVRGVRQLAGRLSTTPQVLAADLVISLVPQSDMALARTNFHWVAYTRGLPWPATGETNALKRLAWQALERSALSRAQAVWATTRILRDDIGLDRTRIVPAGIRSVPRTWDGGGDRSTVVWAARFDADKRPELFVQALRSSDLTGVMYGSGGLQEGIRAAAPDNVEVAGWTSPDRLWHGAMAYVGTSAREAFGRSAVEAAMSGIPIVVSRAFGSADLLVTDPTFRRRFVLDSHDPVDWRRALDLLRTDPVLRQAYSDHLVENSASLTIESSAEAVRAAAEAAFTG